MKKQLEEVAPGTTLKIHTIPMGVDLSSFKAPVTMQKIQKSSDGKTILTVGRLIDWKGTDYLIEALPEVLSRIPEARLMIIGRGPMEGSLRQKVKDLRLEEHVEFLGTVSDDDLRDYYRSADVFVLPSINLNGRTEGLGVVVLEAMASGCPVIGSNVGGIPDIITDGENGILVPERDPHILAREIIHLLSDKERCQSLKSHGYERVREQFSWTRISDSFLSVYLLAKDSPGGKK